ncbi:LINE-1 retrotransposable element ORF2 protein [Linum grandiflorum]
MIPSILSWNVRGVGALDKRFRIAQRVKDMHPNVVCFQETKAESCDIGLVRSLVGSGEMEWEFKPSVGASGGILTVWDSVSFELQGSWVGEFSVVTIFRSVQDDFVWVLVNVYGPCALPEKAAFLEEVRGVIEWWDLPAIIVGDFNMVRAPEEARGWPRPSAELVLFNDFVADLSLIELPLGGASFTWSNFREVPSLSRIDRVFVTSEWEEHFPGVSLVARTRTCSDHSPLLVLCEVARSIKRPWRFEFMWLSHEGFGDLVASNWVTSVDGRGGVFRLGVKLKRLKAALVVWNKTCFKRVDLEIKRLIGAVESLDKAEEISPLEEDRRVERCNLKCELDKMWKVEEVMWKQRARDIWLKAGDRNTRYFHRTASHNRRKNFLDGLVVDGVSVQGQEALSSAIVQYFSNFYSEPCEVRPFPRALVFEMVDEGALFSLGCPFTEEEVRRVVFSCEGSKAPGPDGFQMGFYKTFWEVIKKDVMSAFDDFYANSFMPRWTNSTFVCLIPKKDAVEDIKDLRPISLVGSVYKLVSKVLMERLKRPLESVISPSQCAFIGGRQILDAALIANEVIDARKRSGRAGLVFKLDLQKAYDHVNWNSLFEVLEVMGFSAQWIGWMRACITSVYFSILVNGEAAGYFQSSRGLRQGDSLSPFLFLLIMEILSKMIGKVREAGWFRGFHMQESADLGEVTHIFYADDAMLFCDAEESQVRILLATLVCFENITGLRVNVHKSLMFVVGEVDDAEFFAEIFGCEVGHFPASYLGLPLGAKAKVEVLWDPVISSIQGRLQSWKARFLSFGARLVLLKSVLANLPIYFLSVLKAPASVISKIEQIQNRFLWEGVSNSRKFHLVEWNLVKTDKARGGLGVLDVSLLNKALLSKWAWRFATELNSWWRVLINHKCKSEVSSFQSAWGLSAAGSSWWRWIVCESAMFWNFGFVDPGGGWVSFWHDFWVRGVRLSAVFPRVAASLLPEGPFLNDYVDVDGIEDFPCSEIWNKMVPTKIQGFLWLVFHGSILTLDNLQRRGMLVANWCVLCRKQSESITHLFLDCPFALGIWHHFSSALSFFGPLSSDMPGVVRGWKGMNCSASAAKAKEVWLHAFVWFVWAERNGRIFRDVDGSPATVCYKIAYAVGEWMRAADFFSNSQLRDWLRICSFPREPD